MKKYGWIIVLVAALIISGIVYFYFSNSKPNSNYSAERSSLNNSANTNTNNISNSTKNNVSNKNTSSESQTPTESEIASFSTKVKNKKDTNRQGNITITCNALNNTIVKPGETFSFCDTVGESTEDRGYKEANVIIQGTETKGLGRWKLPSKFYFI